MSVRSQRSPTADGVRSGILWRHSDRADRKQMSAFRASILGMPQSLRDVALDLGLEDDIPLFEVAQSSVMARPDTSPDEVISELSGVLVQLFHERRIAVYEGPWQSNNPPRIYGSDAVERLADLRRYRPVRRAPARAPRPEQGRLGRRGRGPGRRHRRGSTAAARVTGGRGRYQC
jgi:hypothetical protein